MRTVAAKGEYSDRRTVSIEAYDDRSYPCIPDSDTAIAVTIIVKLAASDSDGDCCNDSPNGEYIWISVALCNRRNFRSTIFIPPSTQKLALLDVPAENFLICADYSLACA